MGVLITGAVQTQIVDEVAGAHELSLFYLRPIKGRKSITGDLSVNTAKISVMGKKIEALDSRF